MKLCVMTWYFLNDNFKNYLNLTSLLNIKKKDSSEVYGGQLLDLYGKFNSQILSTLNDEIHGTQICKKGAVI